MAKAVLVLVITIITSIQGKINRDIESRVVEGDYADIENFGYAAYLGIQCDMERETSMFSCGSSILNQAFLLTAAHCLSGCKKSSFIAINVGSAHKRKGIQRSCSKFLSHVKYGISTMENDIALIKLKATLQFGDKIYRVALMENPSYENIAVVSGWGQTNEITKTREKFLKYTKQRLWSRSECQELLGDLPKHAFCAGEKKAKSYPSFGDSGGALVIGNSIQIGIVSYKVVAVSRSVSVYTNVSHYFNWIQHNARQLNC